MKIFFYIALAMLLVASCLFVYAYTGFSEIEKQRFDLYFKGEWSFFPRTEIEKQKSLSLRNDSIFLAIYTKIKTIKDDDVLDRNKLILNKDALLDDLHFVSATKGGYTGLELLLFGGLTKRQNDVILLFYEPYPNWHRNALVIASMSEDEKEKFAKNYDFNSRKMNLEEISSVVSNKYFKDKTNQFTYGQ